MTPYQHHACEVLRTALNAIHRQLDEGMMPAELAAIEAQCDAVEAFIRDSSDTVAQRWQRAVEATRRLLHEPGDDVRSEWIAAYAEIPPMA